MNPSFGSRLGPYEILSPAGAGGMGQVFRARDTRLERTVAIKVLPSHLSNDPQLKQRFEREARAISSLSHPHICTLYDVGEHDGTSFLVMEFLEGQTLAERLRKGPLALESALSFAIQIADALDKAHRQGIVHRDLKPGNIMLTKAGVKLLDFGLAKLTRGMGETGYRRVGEEADSPILRHLQDAILRYGRLKTCAASERNMTAQFNVPSTILVGGGSSRQRAAQAPRVARHRRGHGGQRICRALRRGTKLHARLVRSSEKSGKYSE